MVKPTYKELFKVNDMNYEDLRPEFRKQCDEFIADIFNNGRPKKIGKS